MNPRKKFPARLFPGLLVLAAGIASAQEKPAASPAPAPLERTFSSSQQIVIYGSTRQARSNLSKAAEDLRMAWMEATGLSDDWKWSIVLNMDAKPVRNSPAPRTGLFLGDEDTAKIQVDFPPDPARSSGDTEIEILRAIALEYMYRTVLPKPKKPFTLPPDWLVEGVWQESAAEKHGLSTALFERLVEMGPPPKLDTFLRQRPQTMDPTSRAIYRAQSMTLLRALLATKNGKESLSKYLVDLTARRPEDPEPLVAAFPELKEDPSALVKQWTLAIARASASDRIEPLSVIETEKQLGEILNDLKVTAGKKDQATEVAGPMALPVLAREESGRFVIKRKAEDLLRLEGRSHPIYRPIVEQYRMISSELAQRPRRDAEKRLAAVGELRTALLARCQAMIDYVNWFEVTKMETPSEAFSPEIGSAPGKSVSRRSDPISLALDSAEVSVAK